jgi:hypothetical protein
MSQGIGQSLVKPFYLPVNLGTIGGGECLLHTKHMSEHSREPGSKLRAIIR